MRKQRDVLIQEHEFSEIPEGCDRWHHVIERCQELQHAFPSCAVPMKIPDSSFSCDDALTRLQLYVDLMTSCVSGGADASAQSFLEVEDDQGNTMDEYPFAEEEINDDILSDEYPFAEEEINDDILSEEFNAKAVVIFDRANNVLGNALSVTIPSVAQKEDAMTKVVNGLGLSDEEKKKLEEDRYLHVNFIANKLMSDYLTLESKGGDGTASQTSTTTPTSV